MKSVLANPEVSGWMEIGDAPEPVPDSHEVVVAVTAFSVNRGEVNRARNGVKGAQVGWDLAGVVEKAATNGSGPPVGARVVGFSRRQQAWAERVALPVVDLAEIPSSVSDAVASTLPVAGLTALYALERCDRLLADRVLITGATGGVGWFACQLAKQMGATPVALLRSAEHARAIEALGAEAIISADGAALADHAKFRWIIDGVGGSLLPHLVRALDTSGRLVNYGVSGGQEATIPVRDLLLTGDGAIEGFHLYRESEKETAAKGLARLLRLLDRGQLDVGITVQKDWSETPTVAAALINREYLGKAVLTL